MRINLFVDTTRLAARLNATEKRMAYALQKGLNNTALRIQREMREKVTADFTVRQKQFITRMVAKIGRTSFANVKQGQAWVEIEVGQAPRLLLSKFERGGERLPFIGKNIALPVIGGPARPSLSRRVPKAWTFEALQFHHAATRTGRDVIVSANQSAYIVPGVGVFQRMAEGTRLVYAFIPHMTLDQRLEFVRTAREVARSWFNWEIETQVIEAIEYAEARGGKALGIA